MFSSRTAFTLAGLVLSAVTLGGQATPSGYASYPLSSSPAAFQPAIERADQVITSLRKALLGELTRELDRGGPSHALKACHLEAIEVAQQVSREHGFAAGRTSHRLRNPLNAPRPWAADIVARHAGGPAGGVEGYVVELGDRVGVMRPIAHVSMCSGCHGSATQIPAGVRKELEELYPADAATNFQEGQIRGWFWVEVPKAPAGFQAGERAWFVRP